MSLQTTANPSYWLGSAVQGSQQGKRALEWVVDLVLTLQLEGQSVTPALQQLIPMAAVVVWAQQHRTTPTWEDICTRWSCSRASAFRWLPALLRARAGAGRA